VTGKERQETSSLRTAGPGDEFAFSKSINKPITIGPKHVAKSSHGLQIQRPVRICFGFASNPADQNVNDSLIGRAPKTTYTSQQLFPGKHNIGKPQKKEKEPKLHRAAHEPAAVYCNFSGALVHTKFPR